MASHSRQQHHASHGHGSRARSAHGQARSPRAGLSADKIVAAALALIDAHGLSELSMRTLGKALGTSAMALYFHYPSKEELLAAVGGQLVAAVPTLVPQPTPAPASDARALASAILRELRAVHDLHRNAYPLLLAALGRDTATASWAALFPRLSKDRAELLRITLLATAAAPPSLDAELLGLFFG